MNPDVRYRRKISFPDGSSLVMVYKRVNHYGPKRDDLGEFPCYLFFYHEGDDLEANREIFERRALEYSQKLADEWRDFVKVVDSDSVPTLFLDGSEEHMPLWAEPRG